MRKSSVGFTVSVLRYQNPIDGCPGRRILKNGGSVCGCRTCGDGAIWFNFANWIDYDGLASRRVIVKSATEPSGILSKWWKKVLAIYDEEEFGREFTQMHANERQGNDASRSDFPGGGYGTTERACHFTPLSPFCAASSPRLRGFFELRRQKTRGRGDRGDDAERRTEACIDDLPYLPGSKPNNIGFAKSTGKFGWSFNSGS